MKYSSCLWLFMSTCVSFVETFLFYVYCQYWCILCPSKKKVCARACMCTHVLKWKNKTVEFQVHFIIIWHSLTIDHLSFILITSQLLTDCGHPLNTHTLLQDMQEQGQSPVLDRKKTYIYIYIWYRHLQWFLKFLLHKIWWTMKNSLLCHPNYTYMHQNFNKVSNLTTVVVFQNHSSTSRHVNCSSILGFQFQIQFLSECRTRCRITRKQCRVSLRA